MSDDLIGRLHALTCTRPSHRSVDEVDEAMDAAADELARLHTQLGLQKAMVQEERRLRIRREAELDSLRAEAERLRGVLRKRTEEADRADERADKAEAALSDERAHADALMDDVRQRLSYDAETFHDQGAWDREDACLAIMKRIDLHRARRQG